jgi:hypothetical protein
MPAFQIIFSPGMSAHKKKELRKKAKKKQFQILCDCESVLAAGNAAS